jgi:MFS family permease
MHLENPRPASPLAQPWYRDLTRYHWFVFVVAALGWLFDTMDQQLFVVARNQAVSDLLGVAPEAPIVKEWGPYTTAIFLVGWATGGIIFGILGDRIGRVKTMALTILVYSAFTGLSAISLGIYDFALYRFLTGLGVGGEFAVGVALVAEVMPDHARPHALGLLQGLSAVGNITAALTAMVMGELKIAGWIPSTWRAMFVVGIVPALLVFVILRRVREPERWAKATAEGKSQHKPGSYAELFGDRRWRRSALVGLLMASAGVIGLWSIGFFSSELVSAVLRKTFREQHLSEEVIRGKVTFWVGINSLLLNLGAFCGIYAFSQFTVRSGRKPAFAIAFVAAAVSTAFVFWSLDGFADIFWMIPIMGFCQLSLFGGYAIYFPELFPTRLRSTGTSFCYNVGRYVAACGTLTLGGLAGRVFGGYSEELSYRYAGITMCSFYLLGLLALPFAPETKGQPLPE